MPGDAAATNALLSRDDLGALVRAAALTGTERVLDLDPMDGESALMLAPRAQLLIATTPSLYLDIGVWWRRLAAERGLTNIAHIVTTADPLPFPDGAFDLVTCRYVATGLPDLPGALWEIARVLRPGGRLLVIDIVAPEDPALDSFINEVARLRNAGEYTYLYRLSMWEAALTKLGLRYELLARWDDQLYLPDPHAPREIPIAGDARLAALLEGPRPVPEMAIRLAALLDTAPAHVVQAFKITRSPPPRSLLRPAALFAGTRE